MQSHIQEEIAFRQCQPAADLTDENGQSDEDDEDESNSSEDESLRPQYPDEPSLAVTPAEDINAEQDNLELPREAFDRDQAFRLLSYAVKTVLEDEGIVPIVNVKGHLPLADRVRGRFANWFGQKNVQERWAELGRLIGKPAEDWLGQDYFDYHVNMYYKRPIVWQLSSASCTERGSLPGAFSCFVYYHNLRSNTLQNVIAHYLTYVIELAQAQYNVTKSILESLVEKGAKRNAISDAANESFKGADQQYRELIEFRRRIRDLDTGLGRSHQPPAPTPLG